MRPIVALLALSASCFAACAVGAVVADERPLVPGKVVHLRIEAGTVTVRPGESGKVAVQADLVPGQRLVWRESADRLVLVVDDAERLTARDARVEFRVPPEAGLRFQLGQAALDLEGVGGPVLRIDGGDGAVRVATEAPNVTIDTRRGSVEATLASGRLVARSTGGAQRLSGAGAVSIDASSVSGPIEARLAVGAPFRLASVSGAIELRVGSTEGLQGELESLSGPLRLRMASPSALDVTVRQAAGSVRLPPVFLPSPDGRWRIGEGTGAVRFSTFRGDVEVLIDPPAAGAP